MPIFIEWLAMSNEVHGKAGERSEMPRVDGWGLSGRVCFYRHRVEPELRPLPGGTRQCNQPTTIG
jgi:hypothetical protein